MVGPSRRGPIEPPHEAAVYVISVAAELSGLHPQTLRTYERLGLITPRRTGGGGRRYSASDVELLRGIAELTSSGIGIEGVRRILELEQTVAALRDQNARLAAELEAAKGVLRETMSTRRPSSVPGNLPVLRTAAPGQSLVVWRRSRG